MRKTATIFEIAKRAGVTNATVSRALRRSPLVKEATRDRVLRIANELNYRISTAGRGLATGRTQTIGLVTPSLRYPLNAEMAEEVQKVLGEMNYGLLVASLDNQDELAVARLRMFSEHCVDGIILQPTMSNKDVSCIEMIRQYQIPFVVSADVPEYDVPFASFDNYDGLQRLTRHVLDQGYRCPALITSWPSITGVQRQTQAFGDVMAERGQAGISYPIIHQEQFDVNSIIASVESVMKGPAPVDCLIITDCVVMMHACLYLRGRGIRVGSEIGLAAAEDAAWFHESGLSITCLRFPMRQVAQTLVTMLQRRIEDPKSHKEAVYIKAEMLCRSSTRRTQS